jgi:hypothetical protein
MMPTMYAVLPLVLLLTLAAMLGPAWLIGREQHESATGARTSSSPSSCPVVGCTGGLDCVSQLLGRPCRMADTMPFPAVPARLWSETQAIAAQAERDHAAALATFEIEVAIMVAEADARIGPVPAAAAR